MTSASAVVQSVQLTKVFKDFWRRPKVKALDGLSFEIQRGEVFGLLGPNGSGKSTTIKLILGLLFPTRGRVTVLGRNPRDIRMKSRIGFMPEDSYLYPYLTAEETLDFFGRIFDIPRRERRRRVESLIRMVGLTAARRRPLSEFSKGMARRIGLAQALIGDPELLLLDEPTTGLDPIGTREVKDLIVELRARGKTVLLSSHLLADVEGLCDRVAILYGGRLRSMGSVGELLTEKRTTQISAPELSKETVREVIELIRAREGAKPVEVGHPMGRLEDYFLHIVRQARKEHVDTSGAVEGELGAAFVIQDTEAVRPAGAGADVLARLAEPAPAAEEAAQRTPGEAGAAAGQAPPEEAAAEQGAAARRAETLDRLAGSQPAAAPAEVAPAGEPKPAPSKDVLDRLLGGQNRPQDRKPPGGGAA